ncbi:MAG: MarR family transcriptional regulator [bacterium]|nr:MarR family transcriptional regulator [bacterium]MCP4964951.1 MarR family transcriptional regulator [bacterium]
MPETDPDSSANLQASVAEAIESFSLVFEQFGFPRMGGRIFAYLILSDEPYVTQSELTEALQASTGSISTMVRMLEQIGFLERVSLPGHRRDRFRLRTDPLVEMTRRRIEGAINVVDILNRAKVKKEVGPIATARLERAESFYRYFHVEMELALVRWLEANPLPAD